MKTKYAYGIIDRTSVQVGFKYTTCKFSMTARRAAQKLLYEFSIEPIVTNRLLDELYNNHSSVYYYIPFITSYGSLNEFS